MLASKKSLFLKHSEGSTQHETFLVVLPGSLYMFVYTEFTKKKDFEQLTLA